MNDYVRSHPLVQPLLATCDHYDHKTIEAAVSLREFLAGMFNYYPTWLRSLYAIRWGFVRLLGMRQQGVPQRLTLSPETLAFEEGSYVSFFKVVAAQEAELWLAGADDKHLTAYLAVAVEPLDKGLNRFHCSTLVMYKHWTGPLYFNVIRPFHHVVVKAMLRAGATYPTSLVGASYSKQL